MKHSQPQPSKETQQEAQQIAKATQKPGQTKEQTKLIAQGIEKGIAVYKKQQKEKKRQADKAQKKIKRDKQVSSAALENTEVKKDSGVKANSTRLPWFLLATSWIGFIAYTFLA